MRALDLEALDVDEAVTPDELAGLVFQVDVLGEPQQQGSKVARHTAKGQTFLADANRDLGKWRKTARQRIEARIRYTGWVTLDGPCRIELTFWRSRLPSEASREYPHTAPDVDKLARACLDALQEGGAIKNDARAVDLFARKRFSRTGLEGVRMVVTPLRRQAML